MLLRPAATDSEPYGLFACAAYPAFEAALILVDDAVAASLLEEAANAELLDADEDAALTDLSLYELPLSE